MFVRLASPEKDSFLCAALTISEFRETSFVYFLLLHTFLVSFERR
jgi:hypothetical protein